MITTHVCSIRGVSSGFGRALPPRQTRLRRSLNGVARLVLIAACGLSGCERSAVTSEKSAAPETSAADMSTMLQSSPQVPEGAKASQGDNAGSPPELQPVPAAGLLNRAQRILGRWNGEANPAATQEPSVAPLKQDPAPASGLGGATTQAVWNSLQQLRQAGGDSLGGTAAWAQETYEYLKQQGLTQAGSAQEWLAGELQKKGTWEYRILVWNSELSAADQERVLNDLGRENWECFQIDRVNASEQRVYLKRRVPSLLETLPVDRAWQIFQLWK